VIAILTRQINHLNLNEQDTTRKKMIFNRKIKLKPPSNDKARGWPRRRDMRLSID